MRMPPKLKEWLENPPNPNKKVTQEEQFFTNMVYYFARLGVGFGFMQQVIEWVWQEFNEIDGYPATAWGPEYFNERIADLEAEIEHLRANQRA